MTPQERQLVADLFDRLATLEGATRDADAERAIGEGLARAPNATYALVQSVLVQDEALKKADARIRELEAALDSAQPASADGGGFLNSMRDNLFGRREGAQGSVPSVRGAGAPANGPMGVPPGFRTGAAQASPGAAAPQEQRGAGGSFLGTAAAAAAGVIGGALLLDGIKSMMGGQAQKQAGHGALDTAAAGEERSPWGSNAANSDLAREAGAGDIGSNRQAAADPNETTGYGLFDQEEHNVIDDEIDAGDGFDIGDADII